ncbi:fumarylacetoacetate hydrolase family protein [Streptomyces sp. NPDC048002]|uniref:fumarylacetoacetate hydrolase family protein n=1 Tax=Streptomyces sp. NPDC048002 TaxID=3154344 RepID=UPI0033F66A32
MRLATFLPPGEDLPLSGEVRADQVIAFDDGTTVLDRLTSQDRTPAAGRLWDLDQVTLLAPIPRPRAIFAIGLNYLDHVGETATEVPEKPLVFLKLDTSSAAPNAPVVYPDVVTQLDYEGELAVVIGPGGQPAGYAVADDLSARDLQLTEGQWTRGKAFDGSCPWGPWITTADEIDDPHALRLTTHVNGQVRQEASTMDMVFDIPTIVAFIAQTCTLLPGDLILTGTPAGVGLVREPPALLAPGDTVRVEITQLGRIEHQVAGARSAQ